MFNARLFFQQLRSNLRQNITAMASTDRTSLSARSPTPTKSLQNPKAPEHNLEHAPGSHNLKAAHKQLCNVKPLTITVSKSDPIASAPAYLHVPQNYRREQNEGGEKTAAIFVSGAGGGLAGPSSTYLSMADKLASLNRGIPALRLDYRYPARARYCIADLRAAMDYLRTGYAASRFVLVGWSFGGAVAIEAAAEDERIVGVATLASQSAETEGIDVVARRSVPLLVLHGGADQTLSPECSRGLAERYGYCTRGGEKEMVVFEGDDHAFTGSSRRVEKLVCGFVMRCAGETVSEDEQSVLGMELLGENEKVEGMEEGGDLRGNENVK